MTGKFLSTPRVQKWSRVSLGSPLGATLLHHGGQGSARRCFVLALGGGTKGLGLGFACVVFLLGRGGGRGEGRLGLVGTTPELPHQLFDPDLEEVFPVGMHTNWSCGEWYAPSLSGLNQARTASTGLFCREFAQGWFAPSGEGLLSWVWVKMGYLFLTHSQLLFGWLLSLQPILSNIPCCRSFGLSSWPISSRGLPPFFYMAPIIFQKQMSPALRFWWIGLSYFEAFCLAFKGHSVLWKQKTTGSPSCPVFIAHPPIQRQPSGRAHADRLLLRLGLAGRKDLRDGSNGLWMKGAQSTEANFVRGRLSGFYLAFGTAFW